MTMVGLIWAQGRVSSAAAATSPGACPGTRRISEITMGHTIVMAGAHGIRLSVKVHPAAARPAKCRTEPDFMASGAEAVGSPGGGADQPVKRARKRTKTCCA